MLQFTERTLMMIIGPVYFLWQPEIIVTGHHCYHETDLIFTVSEFTSFHSLPLSIFFQLYYHEGQ